MSSTQTTIAGILTIMCAVFTGASALLQGNDPDIPAISALVFSGIGLIRARDNNKTSEEVKAGVKKL